MPARCLPYLAYIAYDPTTYRQFGIFVLVRLHTPPFIPWSQRRTIGSVAPMRDGRAAELRSRRNPRSAPRRVKFCGRSAGCKIQRISQTVAVPIDSNELSGIEIRCKCLQGAELS